MPGVGHRLVRSFRDTVTDRHSASVPSYLHPNTHVYRFSLPMSPPPSSSQVLVIDDDPIICETMRLMLEPHYPVTTAETIVAAKEHLLEHRDYALVLCDMMMRDGTGADLYAWMQVHIPNLVAHTVFMTGGAYTAEARRFFRENEVTQLQKPFSFDALLEVLPPQP